jgi:nucleotide-binding universal stress UspA family protein
LLKKILVPMDGSERAEKAFDFALDLAKTYGAKLWIINVADKSTYEEMEKTVKDIISGVHIKDYIDKYAEWLSKEIFDKVSQKSRDKGVEIETYSVTGKPAEEILSYAKKMSFDLIVIGSTGIGKAEQFLFGSTTDKVARHSTCAVTIVK